MKKCFLLGLSIFSFWLACDEKVPTVPMLTDPEIISFTVPDTLPLNAITPRFMSVRVTDPQGVTDISRVTGTILDAVTQTPIRVDTLHDTGADGDILPQDGVFVGLIHPNFSQGRTGAFRFKFEAIDQAGHRVEKLSALVTLLDVRENAAPAISQVQLPSSLDLFLSEVCKMKVQVTDPEGLADIREVRYQVFNPTEPRTPNQTDTLNDRGVNGDSIAGDGIYTTTIGVGFARKRVGLFTFRFQALDRAQNRSLPIVKTLLITNNYNQPPVISAVEAIDTLRLDPNKVVLTTLMVTVDDPQGLADVKRVLFNSYLPDGRPSSQNPFYMTDDGQGGDEAAGDGVYSLTVNLPPGTPPGKYKFVFEALDFSGARSNQITHVLVVVL